MTTNDKIKDEQLPYVLKRKATKKSALLSANTDKYEYLASK